MASPAFGSSAQSHTQANLPSLSAHLQSDTHLTAHLASRFHVSLPTARLGSQGLVSVNTYTTSAKGPDGGTEGSAMGEAQEMAGRILSRMAARSENQAVVFLGESGSGKTTVRAHLLSSLLAASSTPLSTKISLAAFLFDTLTTTKTVTTPTASKAGLFLELQYDGSSTSRPTLIGGKLLDHRLERSRIASVPTGERTFHILYYLLAGTSPAEKAHLGLDTPGLVTHRASLPGSRISATVGQRRWRYLGHPTQLKVGINDGEGFQHFKTALRKLEFLRGDIAQICQILATILHLGQLEFHTSHSTTPSAEESGGYAQEGGEDITCVKNREVLEIAAAFLGLGVDELDARLGYKTKTIHRERVTVMLDPKGARANADELARTLYSLLTALIIEQVNQRLCAFEESIANTISLVDFPGFEQAAATGSVLDQLLNNAAAESMYNLALQHFFERRIDMLESEEVRVAATSYFDNTDATKGLLKSGNGLLSILDDQARRGRTDTQFLDSVRKRFEKKNNAITASSATVIKPGSNFPMRNTNASFAVKHFGGEVDYPIEGLIEANGEVISGDMMNLMNSSTNDFVRALFGQESVHKVMHPQEKTAVMQAQLSSKPSRMPSMARRRGERSARLQARRTDGPRPVESEDVFGDEHEVGRAPQETRKGNSQLSRPDQGAAGQFQSSLDVIRKSVTASGTNSYFVFCLKPNDRRIANQFDSKCVRAQIQTLGIAEISQRLRNADFSVFLPFGEFLGLANLDSLLVGTEREKVDAVLMDKQWPANEARTGTTGVFLSERCWATLVDLSDQAIRPKSPFFGADIDEDEEYALDENNDSDDAKAMLIGPDQKGHAKKKFGSRDIDGRSDAGASAFNMGDMFRHLETRQQLAEKGNSKKLEEVEEVKVTGSRRRWLALVRLLTWYLPDAFIKGVIRKRRRDIQIAWREKFAINILIWLSCLFVTFLLIGFPMLICPHQAVFSSDELSSNNGKNGANSYVAIRGVVFDLNKYAPVHYPPPNIVPTSAVQKYAGTDATDLFPVQVSSLCQGYGNVKVDQSIQLRSAPKNQSGVAQKTGRNDPNIQYHDFRASTNDSRPDWFGEQMRMLKGKNGFKVGYIGYSASWVGELKGKGSNIAILNDRVYDVSDYVKGNFIQAKLPKKNKRDDVNMQFMNPDVISLFSQMPDTDVTNAWNSLSLSASDRAKQLGCLDNLFFVAEVDTRNSMQCQFANYFLLTVTILLVSVIGFKFFAALQFGKKPMPEHLDKFVICQVPAYTEDEDSLRRAIDSAARMKYDDKRKLLVVVCDGMIIGQGNDRPTPRIVLDILGVPDTVDPEPLSFESLGEGLKQHNMGKVYSGLYEAHGHIVPFLVIVKIGKPSEVSRPGNRGKRDSQMVLMRFLNRIHYNLPMNPLELEMHHQIRNVIGVNPTFYEFLFQIDADTFVAQDSATRMVDMFVQDSRLIGLCGETSLTNAKSSFITMIQVYEYYISHNLTKAFESLFGSVTCLPGCFSMYRIRAPETGKPLFVSREVIDAYANIRVDTLHMKNLLHLGEDRYLTTLLMKFHPKYKTKYTLHAKAWTVAPDSWTVFMSQRRRWINSTVHNLVELIPLKQLCGFCCFSMRFVVFVDLVSTIVQPVTVFYIAYLIVLVATRTSVVPLTAFILLGAIYGLQAIIFVLRRKWEMIGWMIVYLLAMPVFSLGLPIYAFWHMDDFSWGNTRIVTGEKGRQVLVSDEGVFDPDSIPRKKWEDYQSELLDAQMQTSVRGAGGRDEFDDARSEASGLSYATRSIMPGAGAMSEYGFGGAASRSHLSLLPPQHFGATNVSSESLPLLESGGVPPDDVLLAEIRDVLRNADLMTVTKKTVRLELERRFRVPLDGKRAYISSATEAVLSGQL